ncbi:4-hydroxythreonine-4-phosphate dehydrogenase PdxA [Roseiflexus sp. AH-315-K22]|nr:4-hydroxythreonine-4-phosphate dehydrogenase PdxA [Roseiflexus sp. AH-315-K22]
MTPETHIPSTKPSATPPVTPSVTPQAIAISMGDPGGIGPEVVVASLADPRSRCSDGGNCGETGSRFIVFGHAGTLNNAARTLGLERDWAKRLENPAQPGSVRIIETDPTPTDTDFPPQPTEQGGHLSFQWVNAAIDAALLPPNHPDHTHALVTAPINKAAWSKAGHTIYPGHTELLADRCNRTRYAMMFDSPRLRVVLVTTHIPLATVADQLTTDRILETIELGAHACTQLGVAKPRVAVLGLNPHAGEQGLLGKEDLDVISPAITSAQSLGINATGPHPADTLFHAAANGQYDLVVAMYHDQGLIPVKLLDRDNAVNLTVGLPIVRTSPDHGTAYDIAGKGVANPGSMRAALRLAIRMSANPASTPSGSQQSAPDAKTP